VAGIEPSQLRTIIFVTSQRVANVLATIASSRRVPTIPLRLYQRSWRDSCSFSRILTCRVSRGHHHPLFSPSCSPPSSSFPLSSFQSPRPPLRSASSSETPEKCWYQRNARKMSRAVRAGKGVPTASGRVSNGSASVLEENKFLAVVLCHGGC
jgi:hypothetical protein